MIPLRCRGATLQPTIGRSNRRAASTPPTMRGWPVVTPMCQAGNLRSLMVLTAGACTILTRSRNSIPRYQAQPGAPQHADERRPNDRLHDSHDTGDYELNDAPLEPHEDAMYDDAPRQRRHGGLATALALIGCLAHARDRRRLRLSELLQSPHSRSAAAGHYRRQFHPHQDRADLSWQFAIQQDQS